MEDGRLILGLDLDGVVADYVGALRWSVAISRGVDPDSLTTEVDWNLSQWGLSNRDDYSAAHRRAIIAHQIFLTMKPVEGAVESVRKLVEHGVRIRVTTKRFVVEGDKARAAADTTAWLDIHRIPYHDLAFVSDKSACFANLYLDDAPHVIEGLREAGLRAVVFDQPWNRDIPGERVVGWGEATDLVLEVAQQKWEAAGGGRFPPQGDSPDPARWGSV